MSTTLDLDKETDIDTSILEDLDFDINCDADPCDAPATWTVYFNCGCSVFACNHHLKTMQDLFHHTALLEAITGQPAMECVQCGHKGMSIAFVEPIKPGDGGSGKDDQS
jgi:hypothetical protein